MKILDNPIFLTEKRLVYRSGITAALLIAGLISVCFIIGLIGYRVNSQALGFESEKFAGKFLYSWLIFAQVLVLYAMGFGKIVKTIVDERNSGLFDINRLTPLKASDIAVGYLLGTPLQEFYVSALFTIVGLIIITFSHLSISVWIVTQLLIWNTALFLYMLAFVAGLVVKQSRSASLFPALLLLIQPFCLSTGRYNIINFLLPTYGIMNAFTDTPKTRSNLLNTYENPTFFGISLPPILVSISLQLILGIIFWRIALRKIKAPTKPLIPSEDGVLIFTLLTVVQSGLIWKTVQRHFNYSGFDLGELGIFYVGSIVTGICLLSFITTKPEIAIQEYMRTDGSQLGFVIRRSAAPISIIFGIVVGLTMLPHLISLLNNRIWVLLIVLANALSCFLLYSLLIEFCLIKFKQRAAQYAGLGMFIFCGLPLVIAFVLSNSELTKISFVVPGIIALSDLRLETTKNLFYYVVIHVVVVVIMLVIWIKTWMRELRNIF